MPVAVEPRTSSRFRHAFLSDNAGTRWVIRGGIIAVASKDLRRFARIQEKQVVQAMDRHCRGRVLELVAACLGR